MHKKCAYAACIFLADARLRAVSTTVFTDLLSADPFLLYTLIAALFLGFVSLWSGWRRKDFLTFFNAQGLFHIALAVLVAVGLLLLSQYLSENVTLTADWGSFPWLESLRGLSRLPLYIVALAYGPSAGLLAAALFASFATTTALPGWPEAILALELLVLGWFAIAPSPRHSRWAGPFNALMAYFLAWSTAGSAMLQALTGEGIQWATHADYHTTFALGAGVSMLLLLFIGPKAYRYLFPNSRIAPKSGDPDPVERRSTIPPFRQRSAPDSPPTFGSLWGTDSSVNPFMSKTRWQLTFTPPPELEQETFRKRPERRSLDTLTLQELRAEPRRRHSDTDMTDVAQFRRRERLPKAPVLSEPVLNNRSLSDSALDNPASDNPIPNDLLPNDLELPPLEDL